MKVNFGGFVSISTVDWRGKAVCTVFFRGCPARCYYCHNRELLTGEDLRDIDFVYGLIEASSLVVSGVIFSGGEPTMQPEALMVLLKRAKSIGLQTGVHTNGIQPETLRALIEERCIDHVSLDLKTTWDRYNNLMKGSYCNDVKISLNLLRDAYNEGHLPELEAVITSIRGFECEIEEIVAQVTGIPVVIQQGVLPGEIPLSNDELRNVAKKLNIPVRIRSREEGEYGIEGDRCDRTTGKRERGVLTNSRK